MSPESRFFHRLALAFALSALAVGLLATPALARKAYTLNYGNDTVSAIDTQTNQVVGSPIHVGEGPYSIAITPNGKTAYVLNQTSEDISVIDLQTEQVVGAPIALGETPNVLSISPDGRIAYVTTSSGNVIVIDTQTNQVVGSIPVGGSPWGVAFTPDGKAAYVADNGGETVSVIDTQTQQIVGTPIAVGELPLNIAFTPDGAFAYVVNEESNDVSVIDTGTRQVVATIPVGQEPWGIGITPDGTKAYVSNLEDATVSVIATQTRQVVGSPIPVGEEPYEVAITPDGKTAYVANYVGETVTAINTQTDQPSATIPVPNGPWQIVVAPDQSPIASFAAGGAATAGAPVAFSGLGSSDPDGSVATYDWVFGDGTTALNGGPTPSHRYASRGSYAAGLTVVDNEGCSTSQRFTGRTTYCGETGLAAKTETIAVKASSKFKFGKLKLNRRNGTAKLQVVVPGAGTLALTGKKVRSVKRHAKKAGKVVLTVRPKASLGKALERSHQAKVHIRVKFSPTGGTPRAKDKTIKLIRQPR
jgi:YVTN family beta-propeller protein